MPPNQTTEMLEWLNVQIDADEWWAREASRRDDGEGAADGAHWRWECGEHDQPAGMDPALDEMLTCPVDADCFQFSLRSVEKFPTKSVGPLPVFSVPYAEEQPAIPAGHIVRNDPAATLARVAAHRAILELHAEAYEACRTCGGYFPCLTVRHLATMYDDREGFDESWRPA